MQFLASEHGHQIARAVTEDSRCQQRLTYEVTPIVSQDADGKDAETCKVTWQHQPECRSWRGTSSRACLFLPHICSASFQLLRFFNTHTALTTFMTSNTSLTIIIPLQYLKEGWAQSTSSGCRSPTVIA